MKILFKREMHTPKENDEQMRIPSLLEDIEKTRIALDTAYSGFDNATDPDMIDCYIYEINALLKRYDHLSKLSSTHTLL